MANWAWEALPEEEPHWDPNTEIGRNQLERYQQALLQEVKAGAKNPTTMAKITEVLHESPDFYKRLCEAFQVFTPFDHEAPENQ